MNKFDPNTGKQIIYDLDDDWLGNQKSSTAWDEVKNAWHDIRRKRDDFRWHSWVHLRFWLLARVFRNRPIRVYDWHKKPSWLDVQIELPSLLWGWQHRWIFTVEPKHVLFQDKSFSDAQAMVSWHNRDKQVFLIDTPEDFRKWMNKHHQEVLPIVEFDEIFTYKTEFTEEDVVFYAKLWLRRWWPALANRKIIFEEPPENSLYRGILGKLSEFWDFTQFSKLWRAKIAPVIWWPITRRYYKRKYAKKI